VGALLGPGRVVLVEDAEGRVGGVLLSLGEGQEASRAGHGDAVLVLEIGRGHASPLRSLVMRPDFRSEGRHTPTSSLAISIPLIQEN